MVVRKDKNKRKWEKIDSYTVINITETAIEAELKELPILYKDTEYKVLAFTLDENNLNESMKLSPIYTRTLYNSSDAILFVQEKSTQHLIHVSM